jgi:hypothetical protein
VVHESPCEKNTTAVTSRVVRALEQLSRLPPDKTEVSFEYLPEVAAAWSLLRNLTDALPKIVTWCVVKHYANHDPADNSWKPAVWVGCTTKAQAEELAPAIQKHYSKKYDYGDRFVVEQRGCHVRDILNPCMTVEQYINLLGD